LVKIRKRPEIVRLPAVPTIIKVSEIPSGIYVMRINLPFTLTHLAKAGVKKCFFISNTQKSARTLLGEETQKLLNVKHAFLEEVRRRYPLLARHLNISVQVSISFGYGSFTKTPRHSISYYYCAGVPKLIKTLDEAGFSALPLKCFMIPIEKPRIWINFIRTREAFVASQFGRKMYDEMKFEDLKKILMENPVLQRMKAYICETVVATGKWITCRVPSSEETKNE